MSAGDSRGRGSREPGKRRKVKKVKRKKVKPEPEAEEVELVEEGEDLEEEEDEDEDEEEEDAEGRPVIEFDTPEGVVRKGLTDENYEKYLMLKELEKAKRDLEREKRKGKTKKKEIKPLPRSFYALILGILSLAILGLGFFMASIYLTTVIVPASFLFLATWIVVYDYISKGYYVPETNDKEKKDKPDKSKNGSKTK